MNGRPASPADLWDFRDELRDLFRLPEHAPGTDLLRADCVPALDVYETDSALEVAVDLPGVAPQTVRVLVKSSVLLIAGEKLPRRGRRDASFHLVERGFGRFARAVRLTSPCDVAHATATFVAGELRVSFPKRVERRGLPFTVPVTVAGAAPSAAGD